MPLVSPLNSSLNLIRRAHTIQLSSAFNCASGALNLNRFKFSPAAQHLTLELTGRAFNVMSGKPRE
jgi:hypothetical protein